MLHHVPIVINVRPAGDPDCSPDIDDNEHVLKADLPLGARVTATIQAQPIFVGLLLFLMTFSACGRQGHAPEADGQAASPHSEEAAISGECARAFLAASEEFAGLGPKTIREDRKALERFRVFVSEQPTTCTVWFRPRRHDGASFGFVVEKGTYAIEQNLFSD